MSGEKPRLDSRMEIRKNPENGALRAGLSLPDLKISDSSAYQELLQTEKAKEREEAQAKKRQAVLEKRRLERLLFQATPENAEKTWREALENIETFCGRFGLKLMFNYQPGRSGSKLKARSLHVLDSNGRSHEVDDFFLDTTALSRVKTVPRLRTEIANKLLITIALKGLINLPDPRVKIRLNQELNALQITDLWKTTSRLLNQPPLTSQAPNATPSTAAPNPSPLAATSSPATAPIAPTETATASPLARRVLELRSKARLGDLNAASELQLAGFKNYLDPYFGRKGIRFTAKGPYTLTRLAEFFPRHEVIWVKRRENLRSAAKDAYIKLVRETDPETRQSEFYPVDDEDRVRYCQYKDGSGQIRLRHFPVRLKDIVFLETPFPVYAEAIQRFLKSPLSGKNLKRLLNGLDFPQSTVSLRSRGDKTNIKITTALNFFGVARNFQLSFQDRGRDQEINLKKTVPPILTALQTAKAQMETMSRLLGGGFKLESINPALRDQRVILSKKIASDNYRFEFFLKIKEPQKLALIKITKNNTEKRLTQEQSQQFAGLKSVRALNKFLAAVSP